MDNELERGVGFYASAMGNVPLNIETPEVETIHTIKTLDEAKKQEVRKLVNKCIKRTYEGIGRDTLSYHIKNVMGTELSLLCGQDYMLDVGTITDKDYYIKAKKRDTGKPPRMQKLTPNTLTSPRKFGIELEGGFKRSKYHQDLINSYVYFDTYINTITEYYDESHKEWFDVNNVWQLERGFNGEYYHKVDGKIKLLKTRRSTTEYTKILVNTYVAQFEHQHDGSLSIDGYNEIELVSGILDKYSESSITKLLKLYRDINGAKVNDTCGYHVHVGTADYVEQDYVKLMAFMNIYESVIYEYLPKARSTNRYCRPLKTIYELNDILNIKDLEDNGTTENVQALWYSEYSTDALDNRKSHKYDDTRYAGLNLHCAFVADYGGKPAHVEFRHHSGTFNTTKVLQWIKFVCAIVDTCKTCNIDDITKGFDMSEDEKQKYMFELLGLTNDTVEYLLKRKARKGAREYEAKEDVTEDVEPLSNVATCIDELPDVTELLNN